MILIITKIVQKKHVFFHVRQWSIHTWFCQHENGTEMSYRLNLCVIKEAILTIPGFKKRNSDLKGEKKWGQNITLEMGDNLCYPKRENILKGCKLWKFLCIFVMNTLWSEHFMYSIFAIYLWHLVTSLYTYL